MPGLREMLAQSCWDSKPFSEPEQVQDGREETDPSKGPSPAQRDCLQEKHSLGEPQFIYCSYC